MNVYFSNRSMFYSELQNQPEAVELGDGERITPEVVFSRVTKRPKLEIPQSVTRLTLFVDVQKNLLYWVLMGFADDFTSFILDYGPFPRQPLDIFTTATAAPTYTDLYPAAGPEGALTEALHDFLIPAVTKSYLREDGAELQIERALVDSGWGVSADPIYNFIRDSGRANVIMPSKGIGITATVTPISQFKQRPGEIISPHEWTIAPIKNKRHIRLIRYDTNYWKTFFRNRILTTRGDPGSLSINGPDIDGRMRLLADHLSAEYSLTESASNGRRADIWKLITGRENHWLDGVIGCMVAASERGCRLRSDPDIPKRKPRPAAFQSAQKARQKVYGIGKSY